MKKKIENDTVFSGANCDDTKCGAKDFFGVVLYFSDVTLFLKKGTTSMARLYPPLLT